MKFTKTDRTNTPTIYATVNEFYQTIDEVNQDDIEQLSSYPDVKICRIRAIGTLGRHLGDLSVLEMRQLLKEHEVFADAIKDHNQALIENFENVKLFKESISNQIRGHLSEIKMQSYRDLVCDFVSGFEKAHVEICGIIYKIKASGEYMEIIPLERCKVSTRYLEAA